MESKFKKYDTVCMISGYKNYISNEYAGAGYEDIPGKKYKYYDL